MNLWGKGEFSLCIPEYIVQNFRFVFAWFCSNILILVTNLSTYFNPATTFLLFSQSFVDLTTYTNSLVFVPLPCEIWNFSKFFYSFLYKIPIWFLYSFRSSRLRQTKGEWTFIYFYYCNNLISLFNYIIFFFFQFAKIEIESRKSPFHAG